MFENPPKFVVLRLEGDIVFLYLRTLLPDGSAEDLVAGEFPVHLFGRCAAEGAADRLCEVWAPGDIIREGFES